MHGVFIITSLFIYHKQIYLIDNYCQNRFLSVRVQKNFWNSEMQPKRKLQQIKVVPAKNLESNERKFQQSDIYIYFFLIPPSHFSTLHLLYIYSGKCRNIITTETSEASMHYCISVISEVYICVWSNRRIACILL